MITTAIEAKRERNMSVIDIPNAFIQTQQPDKEKLIMHLRGRMDEIMCVITPKIYQTYVQFKRG